MPLLLLGSGLLPCLSSSISTGIRGSGGGEDERAGDFPGEAPQKTHILIAGLEGGCQFGLRFERPGPGVERTPSVLRMEGAGDAPPDAILKYFCASISWKFN